MEDLKTNLKQANEAYAKGLGYMSESEYHKLWKKVFEIDPYCTDLYHTGDLRTVQSHEYLHLQPIYGTQKAFDDEDLKIFLQRHKGIDLIIQPKFDGVGAIIYNTIDGYKLVLQGNGFAGRDITNKLKYIKFNEFKGPSDEVELIITLADWKDSYGANPRNTVAGMMNRDVFDMYGIVTAISHHNTIATVNIQSADFDSIKDTLLECYAKWSKIWPIDGIMIKVADEYERLKANHNGTYYLWSVAWKPEISVAETRVTGIEWNVSMHGRIIPKIKYDSVNLCGTINSWATCNNAKWLIDKNIFIGAKIVIGKAGEIIPKIVEVLSSNGISSIPNVCPVCLSELKWDGVHLVCTADDCIEQVAKKVDYFYSDKGMDLKGIGKATIIELMENNLELYKLFNKTPWVLLDPISYKITMELQTVLGDVRYKAYIKSLVKIKGKKNAAHFIASLGTKNLAYKNVIKNWNLLSSISNIDKVKPEFINGLKTFFKARSEMKNFKFAEMPKAVKMYYVVTGTLSVERSDIEEYLKGYHWELQKSVTKATELVIVGDSPGKTKLKAAKKYGVKLITEEQINDYIMKGGD